MEETKNDFLEQQRRAIERMNEMHRRSQIKTGGYPMPPAPSFVKLGNEPEQSTHRKVKSHLRDDEETNETVKNGRIPHQQTAQPFKNSPLNTLKLPFIGGNGLDKDMSLILGLILILANEKADRKLLLALLYILL